MKALLLALLALTLTDLSAAERSSAEVRAFKRENPCPATGERRGPCKGHVVDHRIARCVGGPDTRANMRWMTVEAAKAKDRWECRPGWEAKLKDCEERGCFVSPRL